MQQHYPFRKTRRTVIRILYAALISMLAIGSVSPMSAAQAAPPAEQVNFSMEVQNPKTTLRCKETVTYFVKVELAQSNGAPTPAPGSLGLPKGLSVVNVKVEGSSVDKKVGDFVGTATAKTTLVFDDDLAGLGAKLKFKANKPGKTTLFFEGLVGEEYVSDTLEVTVLPCGYKVKAFGQWVDDFTYYSVTAVSDNAVMTADENGQYTGSTSVNWVGMLAYKGCKIPVQMASGQVNYSGEISESDQMMINQAYEPVAASDNWACGNESGWSKGLATSDPIMISMPASGGVTTLSHGLNLEWATPLSGSVTIVVIPVEEEAVSFIPDNLVTSWDDFSNLFGVLLALH